LLKIYVLMSCTFWKRSVVLPHCQTSFAFQDVSKMVVTCTFCFCFLSHVKQFESTITSPYIQQCTWGIPSGMTRWLVRVLIIYCLFYVLAYPLLHADQHMESVTSLVWLSLVGVLIIKLSRESLFIEKWREWDFIFADTILPFHSTEWSKEKTKILLIFDLKTDHKSFTIYSDLVHRRI
jgi:hypothetical protein